MSSPLYEIDLLKFWGERTFATARVLTLDSGFSSEWWVSHKFDGNIYVAGYFVIPLLSSDLEGAEIRCALMADSVMEFAQWAGLGESGVPGISDDFRRAHCLEHLREFEGRVGDVKVEKTVTLYRLALGFNINNPAALIAQAEGLGSVKTVHERLNYGRRLGLLDSPGKGSRRSKKNSVVLDSDYE